MPCSHMFQLDIFFDTSWVTPCALGMVGNEWEPAEKEHFITRPGQNGGELLLYATINQSDYAACDTAAPVPAR